MATEPKKTTGLTYEDLVEMFPEDDKTFRELIDGELVVSPPPATRHQEAVLELGSRLLAWCKEHGGKVYVAPTGVFFSDANFVEPDVLFVSPEHVDRVERPFVRGAPDLVVEVSSPSTRRLELFRKKELYERFSVPEYWEVDLDADRVEVYRLEEGRFGAPLFLGRGEVLGPPGIPGFSISVDDLLGPPPEA